MSSKPTSGTRLMDLCTLTGLSAHEVRYLDAKGLLKPGRTPSGYRVYDESEVALLTTFADLRHAGIQFEKAFAIAATLAQGTTAVDSDHLHELVKDLTQSGAIRLRAAANLAEHLAKQMRGPRPPTGGGDAC